MLRQEIEQIREELAAGRYANEASISQGIVLRLLNSISWPTYDTRIVWPEYSLDGKRVDFALCHPAGKPIAFIEVKKPGQNFGAERQLFEYAFHTGVPMAILTDGREWHFFLPAEQGNYSERRVYMLDLLERKIEDIEERLNRYLNYQEVCSGRAIKAAKDDYQHIALSREIDRMLPIAWSQLVDDEDDLLLELISDKVESLCGYSPTPDAVSDFLKSQFRSAEPSPPLYSEIKAEKNPPDRNHRSQDRKTSDPGSMGYFLYSKFKAKKNAREVLISVFHELWDIDPEILTRYAERPKHGRTRRYLSRDRTELYSGRLDLECIEIEGWWLGLNNSKSSIRKIIEAVCQNSEVRFGVDLIIHLGD